MKSKQLSRNSNQNTDKTQKKRKSKPLPVDEDSSSDDDGFSEIPYEDDLSRKSKISYEGFLEYCKQEDAALSNGKRKKKLPVEQNSDSSEDSDEEEQQSKTTKQSPEDREVKSEDKQNSKKTYKSREEMRQLKKDERERLLRTAYVGNLAPTIKKKALCKLFAPYGQIESIRIRGAVPVQGGHGRTAKKIAVINQEFAGGTDHRLCAYVVFKSKESVEKSLSLNNSELSDRKIRVDTAGKGNYEPNNCVFVGNLPFSATEEEVREQFTSCGDIVNVHLIRDKAIGAVKGFGFIEFSQPTSVLLALKHSGGATINGRPIRVQRFTKKPAKSVKNTADKKKDKKIDNKNTQQTSSKKPRITIPTNLKGSDVTKYIRSKQKKIDKKKKRLANNKTSKK